MAQREKPSLVQGSVSLPASQVSTESILAAAGQQSSEPSATEQALLSPPPMACPVRVYI